MQEALHLKDLNVDVPHIRRKGEGPYVEFYQTEQEKKRHTN